MKRILFFTLFCSLVAVGPTSGLAQVEAGDRSTAPEAAAVADSTGGPGNVESVPAPARVDLLRPSISPTRAVLMTPLFPGWGQLYAKNGWRAALAFAVQGYYWSNLVMNDRKARRIRDLAERLDPGPRRDIFDAAAEELWERMRDFAWWYLGGLLIVALDAHVGAHLFGFEDDPIPVPTRWPDEPEGPPEPISTTGPGGPTLVLLKFGFHF